MANEKVAVKQKPNYYQAYKELEKLKERLAKEAATSAKKREEEQKRELELQPKLVEMRREREAAEKKLSGKTIKDTSYIKNIGVWVFIFTDDTSLTIGAAPPFNSTDVELGGIYVEPKS